MSFIKMPKLGDVLLAAIKKSGVESLETTNTKDLSLEVEKEAETQPVSVITDKHEDLPKKTMLITKAKKKLSGNSYISRYKDKYPSKKRRTDQPATTPSRLKPQHHHRIDYSVYSSQKTTASKTEIKIDKGYDLEIKNTTDLIWNPKYGDAMLNHILFTNSLLQDIQSTTKDDLELNLGVDFGTSSTKVVISDKANKVSFVVPFFNAQGIKQYLMPSRIHQTNNYFYLNDGEQTHQRLKLNFLEDIEKQEYQYRIVAFLGYIIRHAINWLKNRQAYYKNYQIIWRLTVGIPVATYQKNEIKEKMTCLSIAAWRLAYQPCNAFSETEVSLAIKYADQLHQKKIQETFENIEIYVIPELAAQIHGYVTSDSFDPKAANNFLLGDVGAGTVDTALFNVRRGKGKWKFQWYTSSVERHGTMNFNYDRLYWLCAELKKQNDIDCSKVIEKIEQVMQMTDIQMALPSHVSEYLSDCMIKFKDPKKNPDDIFFTKKIKAQIVKDTFVKACDDNYLSKADLKNIPTYLCGGGMRLPFYKQLEDKLSAQQDGYTWIKMSVVSKSDVFHIFV